MDDTPDPIDLLIRAIRSLPPDEQDIVLASLLRGGLLASELPAGSWRAGRVDAALAQKDWLDPEEVRRRMAGLAAPSPAISGETELRTVPVRFPAPQYDRLKSWCGEHGFPMAAVVRGLVERFLEDYGAS